jgi:hypothetical protein
MQYLKIKNSGLIDTAALNLIGASSKDGISSIGQFGSGNKYALAFFLRNGHTVRIFKGKEEIKLSLTTTEFRDQSFQIINFDGQPSSITTHMGKDWSAWQAIREFYSNALDEGDAEIKIVSKVSPKDNETHFYISVNSEVLSIVENFSSYFADDKLVICTIPGHGRILRRSSDKAVLFRKGIRCYNSNKESLYDYDFFSITVGEDRLISYPWVIEGKIFELIAKCDNEEVIRDFLFNNTKNNLLECGAAKLDDYNCYNPSETFIKVMKSMVYVPKEQAGFAADEEIIGAIQMPMNFLNSYKKHLNNNNFTASFRHMNSVGDVSYIPVQTTPLQEATLNKSLDFLKEAGFAIPYEIKTVTSLEHPDILGLADAQNNTILITTTALDNGAFVTVGTIIEEYAHLKSGKKDCTRPFQDFLINLLIQYLQKENAYIL